MAYHSFLVEPISCHAWNKDRTRECRRHRMTWGGGSGGGAPRVRMGSTAAGRPRLWSLRVGCALPSPLVQRM